MAAGLEWVVLSTGIRRGFCRECRLLVGRVFPKSEKERAARRGVRAVLGAAEGALSLAGVEGSLPPPVGGDFEVLHPVRRDYLYFDSLAAAVAEVESWHPAGRCGAGSSVG